MSGASFSLLRTLQVVLSGNLNMLLPNQWLWDMVDEFVYQFQSFCQYRSKPKSRTDEELLMLQECSQVSAAHSARAQSYTQGAGQGRDVAEQGQSIVAGFSSMLGHDILLREARARQCVPRNVSGWLPGARRAVAEGV